MVRMLSCGETYIEIDSGWAPHYVIKYFDQMNNCHLEL